MKILILELIKEKSFWDVKYAVKISVNLGLKHTKVFS